MQWALRITKLLNTTYTTYNDKNKTNWAVTMDTKEWAWLLGTLICA